MNEEHEFTTFGPHPPPLWVSLSVVAIIMIVSFLILRGLNNQRGCMCGSGGYGCPCPNSDVIDEVIDYMCGSGGYGCPCPNSDVMDEVIDYVGYHPSGAGTWYEMCIKYKDEVNNSIECWK
jgi:hypothetical protein